MNCQAGRLALVWSFVVIATGGAVLHRAPAPPTAAQTVLDILRLSPGGTAQFYRYAYTAQGKLRRILEAPIYNVPAPRLTLRDPLYGNMYDRRLEYLAASAHGRRLALLWTVPAAKPDTKIVVYSVSSGRVVRTIPPIRIGDALDWCSFTAAGDLQFEEEGGSTRRLYATPGAGGAPELLDIRPGSQPPAHGNYYRAASAAAAWLSAHGIGPPPAPEQGGSPLDVRWFGDYSGQGDCTISADGNMAAVPNGYSVHVYARDGRSCRIPASPRSQLRFIDGLLAFRIGAGSSRRVDVWAAFPARHIATIDAGYIAAGIIPPVGAMPAPPPWRSAVLQPARAPLSLGRLAPVTTNAVHGPPAGTAPKFAAAIAFVGRPGIRYRSAAIAGLRMLDRSGNHICASGPGGILVTSGHQLSVFHDGKLLFSLASRGNWWTAGSSQGRIMLEAPGSGPNCALNIRRRRLIPMPSGQFDPQRWAAFHGGSLATATRGANRSSVTCIPRSGAAHTWEVPGIAGMLMAPARGDWWGVAATLQTNDTALLAVNSVTDQARRFHTSLSIDSAVGLLQPGLAALALEGKEHTHLCLLSLANQTLRSIAVLPGGWATEFAGGQDASSGFNVLGSDDTGQWILGVVGNGNTRSSGSDVDAVNIRTGEVRVLYRHVTQFAPLPHRGACLVWNRGDM